MPLTWPHRAHVAVFAVMTLGAFDVSYLGLYKAAAAAQMAHPWLWPVLADGFGLSMSLTVWRARKVGQRAPQARVMLYGVTGLSVSLQVLTAPPDTLGRVMHAWPPLLVLLAFEQMLWVLDREARGHTASVMSAPAGLDGRVDPEGVPAHSTPLPRASGRAGTGDLSAVARVVAELEGRGEDVTGRAVADRLGCDPSTGRRKLRELRQAAPERATELALP